MTAVAPPVVSVIVPCFDAAGLRDTLDHLLEQRIHGLEVLVVDDGSTGEVTTRLLAGVRSPQARVIHRDHGGAAAALNLGIAHALGRYICVVAPAVRPMAAFFARSLWLLEGDARVEYVTCWLSDGDAVIRPPCDHASLQSQSPGRAPAMLRTSTHRERVRYDERHVTVEAANRELLRELLGQGGEAACLSEIFASA